MGLISDIVLDPEAGRIKYVALSYGGMLGLGGKLFAVSWDALTLQPDGARRHLLNVDRELLNATSGFDKSNWPQWPGSHAAGSGHTSRVNAPKHRGSGSTVSHGCVRTAHGVPALRYCGRSRCPARHRYSKDASWRNAGPPSASGTARWFACRRCCRSVQVRQFSDDNPQEGQIITPGTIQTLHGTAHGYSSPQFTRGKVRQRGGR